MAKCYKCDACGETIENPYDEHKEYLKKCSKCGYPILGWWGNDRFCANCGAPMTDEAVEMVMERLNKLEETKK